MSDDERDVLLRWSRRPKSPHSIAQRARIVLLAADGLSNNEVAAKVGVNQATVVKWRKRFIDTAISLTVENGRITRIYAIRNPHKLARLDGIAALTRS